MRLLVTGGGGVLGRSFLPLARAAGHQVLAPARAELDLFDADAVGEAVRDVEGILHLATRIQPLDRVQHPEEWQDNDRLRAVASAVLVDAALAASVTVHVQPTVTFVYPAQGQVDETTPIPTPIPILRSALAAEEQAARFAASGRRGVVLRLGLLDGPGTGHDSPDPRLGASLHVSDAGRALLAALSAPSATYNVCRDGERVSNRRFSRECGWHPEH